jgi:hypothetical protein
VCEREDANRTREAGHLDEIQGVVANTLNLQRNGAVGFIDWLGLVVSLKSFCDAFCQLFHLLHVLNMTLPFFSQQLRCGCLPAKQEIHDPYKQEYRQEAD